MRVRSRTLTTVAVLTLTLAVAACGADEEPKVAGSSTSPSASSSAPSPAGTTATPAGPTTPAGAGGAHLTTATFQPAMKRAMSGKQSLRTTVQMTVNGQTSNMTGVQRMGKKPALAVDMNGPAFGGKGRLIVINGIVYVSIKGATPEGKYLRVEPKNSRDPMAKAMAGVMKSMDPSTTFDAFDAGVTSVKHEGTDTISGDPTDRYKVKVNMAKALKAQGQRMPAGTPKTVTYTIWMDKTDLARRMAFELQGVRMVMNTSDWGKPVTIKAPPASAIVKR